VEKQKLLQILINLVKNAKDAMIERGGDHKRLTLRVNRVSREAPLLVSDGPADPGSPGGKPSQAPDGVRIEVIDNGVGIAAENLTRIFGHGFTTKQAKGGRGFGLHHSALAAKQMGGSLTAHSDGPDMGARFTLGLPLEPPGAIARRASSTKGVGSRL
jgi:C4-dicarboxylate-specific signal transduction histidine kinase